MSSNQKIVDPILLPEAVKGITGGRDNPMGMVSATSFGYFRDTSAAGESVEKHSSEAQNEFAALKVAFDCPGGTVLFSEQEMPTIILFLMEGQVMLSMNSSAGRRLILGIANPGDTLGLAASLSGSRYDITAEALHPCKLASIDREDFLGFLLRHPAAYKNVTRELCLDRTKAYEQLRTLGLAAKAPAKLARLLLEWCADGQKTESGTRLFCSFTHGEIGEFIGASRETVSRIFSDFRDREVLESRGSTLIISNRRALEVYAGIESLD